jgi:hypothetical protein
MDKRDFERLLEDYFSLHEEERKAQEKREEGRKDFEHECERMKGKIQDALKELPVKEE